MEKIQKVQRTLLVVPSLSFAFSIIQEMLETVDVEIKSFKLKHVAIFYSHKQPSLNPLNN